MDTIIRNGLIHDAIHGDPFIGDLLIRDGKIAAIGAGLEAPSGAQAVDATGLQVYPGLVRPTVTSAWTAGPSAMRARITTNTTTR